MTNKNGLKLMILAILIFYSSVGSAQYQPLKIGEQVPDFLINNVTNYHKTSLRLSEFRGKYVILDFWDHNCASCLEAFPKMDSLQQQFSKDIQMVTVNPRSAAATTALFKRLKNLHLPKMPFVNADTSLKQLFPYVSAPHHIWIDKEGKFLFPADSFNLNRDSLQQLITHGTIDVLPKARKAILKSFIDARYLGNIGFASYIVRQGKDDFSIRPAGVNGIVRVGSVGNLYLQAYSSLTKDKYELMGAGKLVLEVDSPENYWHDKTLKGRALKEWKITNNYFYQSILPENSKLNPHQIMIEDLERFFNLHATIEKRLVNTLVLVRTSHIDKLKTQGGEKRRTLLSSTDPKSPVGKNDVRELKNVDFSYFVDRVKYILKLSSPMPFKDGTGYSDKIDLTFDANLLDHPTLDKLKNGLRKYDLDVVEQPVLTDVLVLRDLK